MDKSNLDNGTMYVWKKSHKHGIFNYQRKVSYREKDSKPGNVSVSNKKFEVENKKNTIKYLQYLFLNR